MEPDENEEEINKQFQSNLGKFIFKYIMHNML